ncbi:MAG: hypothetical protein ACO28P_10395 [Ilumatobacteraceae bacterium]
MTTVLRLPRLAAACVAAACVLPACSPTILATINTTTTSSVVTTPIPTGDRGELLSQMFQNAAGLGASIVAKDKAATSERLANIESIWIALEPQLKELPNDLATDVGRIVDLLRSAVNKKRPADADKALRFLSLVIDANA